MVPQRSLSGETPDDERQIIEAAQGDPTAPLYVGSEVETDDPVTIASDRRVGPMLIVGNAGTGKTTLCHQIAAQQLMSDSGLCYLTGGRQTFGSVQSHERESTLITPGGRNGTDEVPDEIGTDTTIHSVLLGAGTETGTNTEFMSTLIEQLGNNRYRQIGSGASPYTLVLDGIESRVEWDQFDLKRLLTQARSLHLSIVIAAQTLTRFPREVRQQFYDHMPTYIVGRVSSPLDADLARLYPTLTPDDLHNLPRYQWCIGTRASEELEEIQFTSTPEVIE